jgi:hypothetical protein
MAVQRLIGPRAEHSWTLWEYPWEVARPGSYTLLARAVSASGQKQPLEHDPSTRGTGFTFAGPFRSKSRPPLPWRPPITKPFFAT